MRPDNAVPDVQLLKRFLNGQVSGAEAAPIERYLEQHPDLTLTLAGLGKEDTLVGLLRASAGKATDDPPELAKLMDKLSQIRPAGPQAGDSALGEETYCDLAPPQAADEIGRLGGYRVLKILGVGGMGMVYQAEDVHLQRHVALKVMKPELAKHPIARERFLREARAAAKLKSDHVVTIHHVGEDHSVVFLTMEFLEGMSLEDWLKKGRKPTLAQAARMGRQIALGLADAHARGLMHRDIKPGNIWLESTHQGRVKLLDFGLARGEHEDVQLTQSGAIVGTPAYMAPEQARGAKVDYRADLFSLGVVLYRLTTGRLPFRGDNTMSLLTALALDTPTPPREINADISPRMAALIERLLAKDREQRPQTAKAAADELAAIEREAVQPTPTIERAAPQAIPIEPTEQLIPAASVIARPASSASSRSRLFLYIVAASLLIWLGGVVAAIVVIIRDKDGKKVAEVPVPPGGSVEVRDKKETKKPPTQKVQVRIEPEPLAPMKDGEPLSQFVFVRQPAKLPGVRSWTIARRETGIPSVVAYRPDGQRLAVASWDGSVHIWEAKTGRLLRVILMKGTAVALAWSPDGRVLAVGTGVFKRAVQLWDADTGRFLRGLETSQPEFVLAVAWSADGRTIRGWGTHRSCYTWETAKGKRLHALPIACPYDRPVFSADAQRMAAPMDGNRIVIWDTDTGKEVSRLTAPATVWDLGWSPNGKRLASTGPDGLRIWDVETRKEVLHYPKAGYQKNPPVWSPDGLRVVFNLNNGTEIEVIDVAGKEEPLPLHEGTCLLAWSPDGSTIACINGERTVRLYDAATGEKRFSLTEGRAIFGFAWSPDDRTLALSERFGTFLASADTGQVLAELKQEDWPRTQTAWPMAWSPDGKQLAAQGPDNAVQFWQADGRVHHALADYKAEITSLAWSPDGKRLATTAAGEKRVLIWDAAKGERDRELCPIAGEAQSVKWSADGRFLTFNVPEVGWHVWDVKQDKLVNDPKQWKLFWFDLAPDGRSALVAPKEKDVYRLRDLASGKDGLQLPHSHPIFLSHPTWSADGKMLAVCFYHKGGIELWRGDLSNRLRTLPIDGSATQIAFSRDGKWLAALNDERLFMAETATGRLCGLRVLGRRNNALTISPEGHYTGNENVDSGIVMVVEKDDGTQETLEPAEFQRKYGFKNDPNKVHLLSSSK